jgi:tripartite-type tricarboxylate transporter receptor subunit TctC
MTSRLHALLASTLLALCMHNATAQDNYPNKPIQLISPLSVGTALDALARLYGDKLSKLFGQTVFVQNRPGAGGVIGTQSMLTSAPDGYTIMMTNSVHSINPWVLPSLPYDSVKDFSGIGMVADAPAVLVVNPVLKVRTLAEFIRLAGEKPGTINYGSAGVGTATHLAGASFAEKFGINLVHVPYKNGSDLRSDLFTGRIHAVFAPPAYVLPQIKEGKLYALGASTLEDLKEPLAVPSIAKAMGVSYEYSTWYGLVASSKVPAPILEKLARAVTQVSRDPDVLEAMRNNGVAPRNIPLREFDAFMKSDIDAVRTLVKNATK